MLSTSAQSVRPLGAPAQAFPVSPVSPKGRGWGITSRANNSILLRLHIRAAHTTGVTREELKELLLQAAIYCGVPAANGAFQVAQQVFDEMDREARGEA